MVTPSVRLERLLGVGGMGSVWVAQHLALDTEVAVKFILPEMLDYGEGGTFARFQQEAKAAARVKSPHVVQVFDQGVMEATKTPYIVMELLEGESLGDYLTREGRMSTADTVEMVVQTSRALGKAHEQGIVHRDIKPDNIFLVAGDSIFCKVLDFGIAKRTDQDAGDAKTRTGLVVGSPQYMSPERLKSRHTDFRADLSGVGRVCDAEPEVYGHNLETVPDLYRRVRPGASFERSLCVLAEARRRLPSGIVKSGLMVGLGETVGQVREVLRELRGVGVDAVTLGQYLRPSRHHLPVERYWAPEEFDALAAEARSLGFAHVASSPLTRSSYDAAAGLRAARRARGAGVG
jgi:serine/threonine protein kinase